MIQNWKWQHCSLAELFMLNRIDFILYFYLTFDTPIHFLNCASKKCFKLNRIVTQKISVQKLVSPKLVKNRGISKYVLFRYNPPNLTNNVCIICRIYITVDLSVVSVLLQLKYIYSQLFIILSGEILDCKNVSTLNLKFGFW